MDDKKALGIQYLKEKDYKKAQICLIDSILKKYDDETANILEKLFEDEGKDRLALEIKILKYKNHPKNIEFLRDVTIFAQKSKQLDIALEYFEILLKKTPDDYVAWNNYGLILEEAGNWIEAHKCYKKALSLKDFFSPNFNLGIISRKLHNFDDSIKYLKKAVLQNPTSSNAKYALSMSYMMTKDFKNGYPLYARHMTEIMPLDYKNEWNGKDMSDNSLCIFLKGGVGLGDIIMYSRYIEYIKDKFKTIYILLPETFHSIFKRSFPYLKILDAKYIFRDYDFAITPMHILNFYNLDFTKFVPKKEGYLKTDEALVENFREKYFKTDKLKIGINWHSERKGSRTFFNRSMPIENLEPVFEKFKESAVFYSIQKDEASNQVEKYPFIVDLSGDIKNFDDTASIMKNFDFLISIDSSPAHMAGAIGVKTFMILPWANEWRWFIDDDKTIWYDSIKLIRQNKEGDWASAISKLIAISL